MLHNRFSYLRMNPRDYEDSNSRRQDSLRSYFEQLEIKTRYLNKDVNFFNISPCLEKPPLPPKLVKEF